MHLKKIYNKLLLITEIWDAYDFSLGLEPFEMDKQIIIDSINNIKAG